MKPRIACDILVPLRARDALMDRGFEVVCLARDSEPDRQWLARAFEAGANIFVSSDV